VFFWGKFEFIDIFAHCLIWRNLRFRNICRVFHTSIALVNLMSHSWVTGECPSQTPSVSGAVGGTWLWWSGVVQTVVSI